MVCFGALGSGIGLSLLHWHNCCPAVRFSLAIALDIYKDRSNRWRYVHVILSCVALLLVLDKE